MKKCLVFLAVGLFFMWSYLPALAQTWKIETVATGGQKGEYSAIARDSRNKIHISYRDAVSLDLKYATNVSGYWVASAIDGTDNVGLDTALKVDANDKVHIFYEDVTHGTLKYATNASGTWVVTTLDADDPSRPRSISLAIDSDNKLHVGYRNDHTNELRYATNASGAWVLTTLNGTDIVLNDVRIVVDANNKVHMSYACIDDVTEATNILKYATNASGAWMFTTVDDTGNVGKYNAIARDSANHIHISYADTTNSTLKYATNTSGAWIAATIGTERAWENAIAVDSAGKIHIAYNQYIVFDSNLRYITDASGSWEVTAVYSTNDTGQSPAMALDGNDKVHISFYHKTGKCLHYATDASGEWVIHGTVDEWSSDTGKGTSITVGGSDRPHIGYTNGTYMRYATRRSGLWETTPVEANLMYANSDTAIALDEAGKVHLFFQDSMISRLRYVTNASGEWVFSTLFNSDGHISMALDTNGKFHLSYAIDEYLYYATNASGSWQTTAVDSVCYSGGHTSITLDGNNKAHVAYFYRCFSNEPGYLKYATNASGVWAATTVDNNASVGQETAILTGTAGATGVDAHILYYDITNADLKYATNALGEWIASTIDSSGNVGKNTAMAKDSGGKFHAVYYDVTNGDLKYATNTSGDWVTSTIDSSGDVGLYASMAIDAGDGLHVAYYDTTNTNLKYAYRRSLLKGNINGVDDVTLADAVLALQSVARMNPAGIRANYASSGADVSGDNVIGTEEAIFVLQIISGLR